MILILRGGETHTKHCATNITFWTIWNIKKKKNHIKNWPLHAPTSPATAPRQVEATFAATRVIDDGHLCWQHNPQRIREGTRCSGSNFVLICTRLDRGLPFRWSDGVTVPSASFPEPGRVGSSSHLGCFWSETAQVYPSREVSPNSRAPDRPARRGTFSGSRAHLKPSLAVRRRRPRPLTHRTAPLPSDDITR